jgi:glucose/arabinose dehydrogenase/regulation of enolase protein 1 (concanavalin A-like superfamily)
MKQVDYFMLPSAGVPRGWLLLLLLVLLALASRKLQAQTFPQGFSQVEVANGISNPTVMAFAPDGRIFVAQQNGVLHVIKNGVKLGVPALQLTVNASGERGLIGIALHPQFSTNGYVYLYYTLSNGSRNRVSRFTMSGDVISPSSEVIILDLDPLSGATNHNGGAMHFKGNFLYIAIGENANTAHAQNLDTYHGKVLRINPDGSAPTDNPFYSATASAQRRRVWAYGLRNPYTFDVQPATGRIFVNDVGQDTWEEINDATTGGRNFGWPATEGSTTNPAYTSPVFAYQHGSGDGRGCAITGGVFFNPSATNYPSTYTGKYFYQDLCNSWINYLDLSSGVVRHAFATGLPGQSLALDVGTDGNLYYLSRTAGRLYRIVYTSSAAPVITDQPDNLTVSAGQPASFHVTASGTAPLSYQWRKNNVAIAGATSATYTISNTQSSDAGNYQVVVSNSAGSVVSQVATLTVTTFNAPPSPAITTPVPGALYRGGDVISFSGSATDPEDGTLPASAFTWSVVFHHADHVHDGPPVAQGVRSGTFTIPNTGETAANVFYRLHLTVKDSQGLTAGTFVDIKPRTTTITLNTYPAGLTVTLDGQPVTTPFSTLGVEGIQRTLGVVSPQTFNGVSYIFSSWAHGGAATQNISTPQPNTTYTAIYKPTNSPLPSPWLSRDIGSVGIAGSSWFSNNTFTVSGAGNDIWQTADAFHFAYRPVTGNTEIIARVSGMTNTNGWSKVGVMIRETLAANAKHAMVAVTRGNGVVFQRRTSTGGSSASTAGTGAAPYWVRLVRSGNVFTAYSSPNGTTWTTLGSATISMTANVYVGLPVTSHNNGALCVATFTNVSVSGGTAAAALAQEEQSGATGEFSVYPNPLSDNTLRIESGLSTASDVRIAVMNSTGEAVYEKQLSHQDAGPFHHEADLSALKEGIYVVHIRSRDGDRRALLVKK